MSREIITSRQNSLVKTVCALSEKKARRESGLFRFDGKKLLAEALDSSIEIKYIVYNAEGRERDYVLSLNDSLEARGARLVAVSGDVFDKISEEKSPEGIVTVAKRPDALAEKYSCSEQLPSRDEKILIAESLRDPANLGTVMRSAYALGIDRLVLTDDCAEIYSPKALRSAMGAAFKMRTLEVPSDKLAYFIEDLRVTGRRAFAAALDEKAAILGGFELKRGDFFVIGNEGHGLCEKTVRACDCSVIIPMREGAESLNAAAAAAICIWETVRASR